MQFPLKDIVGLDGLTPADDSILLGTIEIPAVIDKGAEDFIQAVRMNDKLREGGPTSPDFSTGEHFSYWMKAREST